jgi:hypothetical protein
MDLFYLGDCLRGLNLNPTLKMIDKLGGTKKKGEKYIKLEEVERERRVACILYRSSSLASDLRASAAAS